MILNYIGVKEINGSLTALDDVESASFEEIVGIHLDNGTVRQGRVVQMGGKRMVIQVSDETRGISLGNTRTRLRDRPMKMPLSPEILGRVFDGSGWPIDGLSNIFPQKHMNINGTPVNPVSRIYPVNYIGTGASNIDTLVTLIHGQELPIFSGSGMSYNELAVRIARQARVTGTEGDNFAIAFAAIGVKNDVTEYSRRSFDEFGVLQEVVMLANLTNDLTVERTLAPRCALATVEYLAFELSIYILVIMTGMTSYAETLREFSSSRSEIPGREGFPGYLYSDFTSLYERAGMVEDRTGSVTQIPILTMPNGDVTHPVPGPTGYIIEGQIILGRTLDNMGIYPPVDVLPSLSRLMKDGIGEGLTRTDHSALSNQLFVSYAKVMDARSLASIIDEEELSPVDKRYLHFSELFRQQFLTQQHNENRTIDQSPNLGWELLSTLPRSEPDRVGDTVLSQLHKPETAAKDSGGLDEEADGTTNN